MDVVRLTLLTLHLLAMNVASGGPLLCGWLNIRSARRNCQPSQDLALSLAWWSMLLLLVGVMLGVVVGFLTVYQGDDRLLSVLPYFRRKIIWGVLELFCSLFWLFGYWIWLKKRPPRSRIGHFLHVGLALLAATNLLYHFPGLLTVMSRAAHGEIELSQPMTPGEFRQLVFSPNVVAHSLHFSLASLAVTGVFATWIAVRRQQVADFQILGARLALAATLLQIPTGIWLLTVTPRLAQARLLGADPWTTGWFIGSMLGAFYLLQNLAALAFGDTSPAVVSRCRWIMIVTVLLMTGTLQAARG